MPLEVLDVNGLIGKWPYWPVPIADARSAASAFAGWGIERTCICSTRSLFVNWEDGNRETLHESHQHPERFIPFACLGTYELSHRAGKEHHDLSAYRRLGFRGVRLYPQHHSYDPRYESFVDEICDQAAELRMPVLLSLRAAMNWGVPAQPLADVVATIERHPVTTWILSGVNYLHEIRAAASLLKKDNPVYVETSCIMGYRAIEKLVDECGGERILFGSGAPIQHGHASLEKILHADISDAVKTSILAENARHLLAYPS